MVQDLAAIDLAVSDAERVAERWAQLLGLPLVDDRCVLDVSSRKIRFVESAGREGLLAVELPATERTMAGRVTTLSGVEFRLV